MEARLSEKERELVAIGASVAAGCIPCTQYHVKAIRGTPASTEEITRAVDTALCIRAGAKSVMAHVAYEALGLPTQPDSPCCAISTDRVTQLVSIAAAVAANCPVIFQTQIETGRAAGVSDHDIRFAVSLAQMIRAKATEKMDAAAKPTGDDTPAQAASGCGCAP
jgi:AhpD family alkylhydroperoxidase